MADVHRTTDKRSAILEPGECCGAIRRIHAVLFPTPLQKEPVMP
jgi:hypothetical protein